MDPIALRQSKAAALQTAKQITDGAKALNRDLTAEEENKIDELLAQADDFEAKAKACEAKAVRMERLEGGISSLSQSQGRKVAPSAPLTETPTGIVKVKANFEDDPKKGFRSPREFMSMVLDAGMGRPHAMNDQRLRFLATAGSDEQSTFADSYGGFFVPEGFAPGVLKIDPESDPMGAYTMKIPMANPIVKMNARVDKVHTSSVSGGLTVSRRAESDTTTASRQRYEQVVLEAHSLFGLAYATEEILTDSPISFAALLAAGFSDQFTSHIINERLNGTGVGEYMGIMASPCLVSVAKETGQVADTIVYENVIKMRARCWGYGQAIWLANHDVVPQLMLMNQSIGTGGMPVWQPSAREDHPDTLLGRPLIFTEYAKTIGDQGDLVLGNWSQYLEGTLQNVQSAESIHVRFLNHERTFKFWLRNAGAPWWKSALTPKNSSATLSPFVVLDARA